MKIECCDFLLHEIAFYKDSIRPCCSFSIEGDVTPFINNYNGDIEKFKLYLEKRDFYIKQFQDGILPFCYPKCTTYEPSKGNETSFKLNNIIISNYTKCSCNCIYCDTEKDKKFFKSIVSFFTARAIKKKENMDNKNEDKSQTRQTVLKIYL